MKTAQTTRAGRRWITLFCLVPALGSQALGSETPTPVERLVAVREGATADIHHRIDVRCPPEIVEALFDHPVLVGQLWSASDFTPRYRITGGELSSSLHITDPTGIIGEARLVARSRGRREYLGEGKIDHWAVPMLNRGSVAVEVDFEGTDRSTRLEIRVFVRPENWIAGAVVGAFSPVVEKHVGQRVRANARDLRIIVEAIATDPASAGEWLEGPAREMYQELFLGD